MAKSEIVWFDIPVKDFKRAKTFYSKLFGWKFQPMGDAYWMIQSGKETIGGLREKEGKTGALDSPTLFFSATKLDPAVKLAKRLGAKLVGKRVDIPEGMGSFHLIRDLDKNQLGIWAKN